MPYTEEQEREFIERLRNLVETNPFGWDNHVKKDQLLLQFIIDKTPLLNDPIYKLGTRVNWVLNGRTGFPHCAREACGKEFGQGINLKATGGDYRKYCCQACGTLDPVTKQKVEETCLKKYGVKTSNASPEVIAKKQATIAEKFGNGDVSAGYKALNKKVVQTMLERYGVENSFCLESSKQKRLEVTREKYGCDWTLQNRENWELAHKAMNEKYDGVPVAQIKSIKDKMVASYKEFMNDPERHQAYYEKQRNTKLNNRMEQILSEGIYVKPLFDKDEIDFINRTKLLRWHCDKCGSDFEAPLGRYHMIDGTIEFAKCPICYPKTIGSSYSELSQYLFDEIIKRIDDQEFINRIRYASHGGEMAIKHPSGKLIKPDFCVGNKVIEFYGDFWHGNPSVVQMDDEYERKHAEDAERISMLKSLGYETLVIWEHDFEINEQDVIQRCLDFICPPKQIQIDIPTELFGWTKDQMLDLCLNSEFPGTGKWPKDHPIWGCNVAHKLSPKAAWKDRDSLKKAIDNLFSISFKVQETDKAFIKRIGKACTVGGDQLTSEILKRFTIVKIAPKVTALSPARLYSIIKDSNIDLSNGVYCPMAGFGGIIEGAKRWYKDKGILDYDDLIEAYDINPNFCEYFGWKQRDALAQVVETNKVVVACPPFGSDTERWEGTPDNMYYSFEKWCKLLKEHIKAPNYILIGPDDAQPGICGLFAHRFGIKWYPEYSN